MREDSAATLPEGWSLVPLGQLMKFQNGFNTDKTAYGRGLRFANVLEVITNTHLSAHMIPGRVATSAAETTRYHVQRGDVLFNRTSETQEEVGLASVYLDDEPILFGGFVLRGKPTSDILDPIFAGYGLRSQIVRQQIMAAGQGGIRANIGQQSLSKIQIALPGKSEQEAIAEALSDADALIEGLERLIAKKRLIKQGAMQDLLTAKRRLPGFSGEWVETTFGQCFQFLRTGSASRSQLGTNLGVGYIHYGDIHGMRSSVLDLSRTRLPEIHPLQVTTLSRVQDGDLVIADASEDVIDVGKSVEVRGVGSAQAVAGLHTFLLRGNPEIVADGFKAYIQFLGDVRSGIESIATGSSVYGISKKNLAALRFRVPPVEEQAAIGRLFADMDAEIQALETRLLKAQQVKEGMMQNLLTGQIRLV